MGTNRAMLIDPIDQYSYKIDLNEEPPVEDNSLLEEITSIFYLYITLIQNVFCDGNYGFRSVAVCLGYGEDQWLYIRQQLLDELLSSHDDYARVFVGCDEVVTSLSFFMKTKSAPTKHWMLMPETSILIAKRFGVIRGPREFQNHQILTFALVYTNHYVIVQLEGEYPMPPIATLWIRYKAPSATE
uniref:Uncharacterized protein n=1 Tax=Lactuca sativa TaxID=4236 RepID=A0A9R1VMY7_LACSA|nr:hypothetical protein LSAT_V11C500269970 [Lactuca sativa]